jgi:phage-related protein
MATQYSYFPYNNSANYKKFDVVRGMSESDSYYLYATQDSSSQSPLSNFTYSITSWERDDFKVKMTFNKTGSGPSFAPGSLVVVTGTASSQANFTGMVIGADAGSIQFNSNGMPLNGGAAGAISTIYNPAWTSGFMFVPSYSSALNTETRKIEAKFGDGYSQRQRDGLNSNTYSWKLNFENRSDRESRAICNFIDDKGGVDSFNLLMPANVLVTNPLLKYIAVNPQVNTNSFNLNNVNADFIQVFDV